MSETTPETRARRAIEAELIRQAVAAREADLAAAVREELDELYAYFAGLLMDTSAWPYAAQRLTESEAAVLRLIRGEAGTEMSEELTAAIDAVADALNAWDQGEAPRPDTHRHWVRIVAALAASGATLDVSDCECVPGHRCDCIDLRQLLRDILTNAEYPKMEAEGLAAAALGLRWSEKDDRYAEPRAKATRISSRGPRKSFARTPASPGPE